MYLVIFLFKKKFLFLVEEGGGYGKSGNWSDITYFTYFFINGP